jgi:hypothetical protein
MGYLQPISLFARQALSVKHCAGGAPDLALLGGRDRGEGRDLRLLVCGPVRPFRLEPAAVSGDGNSEAFEIARPGNRYCVVPNLLGTRNVVSWLLGLRL